MVSQSTWAATGALRGHCSDVYDMCWSPDAQSLFSGGVDGTTIVWNVPKARRASEPSSTTRSICVRVRFACVRTQASL